MFVSNKFKLQSVNASSINNIHKRQTLNLTSPIFDTVSFTSKHKKCKQELMDVFKQYMGEDSLFSYVDPRRVEKLAEKITNNPKAAIRIGVTGVSGSGKGYFSKIFKKTLYDTNEIPVAIINRDNYLFDYSKRAEQYENGAIGYATAGNLEGDKCIDFKRIISDIKKLESGKTVYPKKRYRESGVIKPHDFENPIEPAKIIIVEGVSLFKNKNFFNSLDMAIYVDVDEKAVKQRWFKRAPSRGKVGKVAVDFYETIKPISNKCTVKFKDVSNIVINPEMQLEDVENFSKDFANVLKKYSRIN